MGTNGGRPSSIGGREELGLHSPETGVTVSRSRGRGVTSLLVESASTMAQMPEATPRENGRKLPTITLPKGRRVPQRRGPAEDAGRPPRLPANMDGDENASWCCSSAKRCMGRITDSPSDAFHLNFSP